MRKLWRFIGCAVLCLSILSAIIPAQVAAADANNFIISSFSADYHLARDQQNRSRLTVTETIVAEFPDFDQNHGILRAIPKTYQGHDVNLKVHSVTNEHSQPWNYTTDTSNDNLVLKIGDTDSFVHGRQTFTITYALQDVTLNTSDRDEFYWDINGDQWQQKAQQVQARVFLSPDLITSLQQASSCYAGPAGDTRQDCSIAIKQDEPHVIASATRPLGAGETLTIAIGFTKDTFAPYQTPLSTILAIAAGIIFLGILPPVLALFVTIRNWRKYGRDPKGRGTIIPEYVPPKQVSVVASGIVLKEGFAPAMISAQIIDLAVRHYVKIFEVKQKKIFKDKINYEVELLKQPDNLSQDEQQVLTIVFGDSPKVGDRVNLTKLANKLYTKAQTFGASAVTRATTAGYFKVEPSKAKRPYLIAGGISLVLGFVFIPFTIGFIIAAIILFIASQAMPARTQQGVQLRDYLHGLRQYMQLAEADRLKVLQGPHGLLTQKIDVGDTKKLVKLYEKLLPYAMLFGIEKEWAKQFADLYTTQPDWYSGSGTFHAAAFASSLHSFSAASTASFTPPSSSSSGGAGGGGSAGGGGGGGGGGGW
jgi:uncharacterized membrane protein YgcG